MQVTNFPNLAPSVCFICNSASAERFVDTNQDFTPPVALPNVGRKYLCSDCVGTAADALGLFDESKQRTNEHEERVRLVEAKLEAYELLEDAFARMTAVTPTTAPKAKATHPPRKTT